MRPSHLHFLVYKPGFKTLISQLYDPEDANLETDAQFGVTRHLIGKYVKHGATERTPAGETGTPWYSLKHDFVMERGTATLPRPPISGKARGERPEIPHLEAAE
jgi:hydroxyquinol 1,2-dioxygenase